MTSPTSLPEYTIRPGCASDLPYVMDTWLNEWRTSKYAGVIPNHLYYETQRTLIEDLLGRGASVVIAQDPADGRISGWAVGELKTDTAVVHYLYVRSGSQPRGLVQSLISRLPGAKPGFVTHHLPYVELKTYRWVPELARRAHL